MHSNRIAYRLHNLLRCQPRCIRPHPYAFLSPILYSCLGVFPISSIAFVFAHPGISSIQENDWVSLFVPAENLESTIAFDLYSSIDRISRRRVVHFRPFRTAITKRTNRLNYDFLSGFGFLIGLHSCKLDDVGDIKYTCRAAFLKENKWRTMIASNFARNRFEWISTQS